jgi:hypothetical protein
MPPNDDAEESSLYYSSSNDEEVRLDIQDSNKEDEEIKYKDTVSQVTMGMFDSVDFLMPGGLSSFSMALPANLDELVLKDLPKTIKASMTSRKSFRVTVEALNSGIALLRKTKVSENNNARSIHDSAKEALKWGGKPLDDVMKKMRAMENNLDKIKSKLTKLTGKKIEGKLQKRHRYFR